MTQSEPARPGGFALFGETLLTGLLVAVASVPVVTFVPATAAGVAHLRRHLNGESESVRRFAADLGTAWRHGWPFAILATAVSALLVGNVFLAVGAPGGAVVAPLAGVVAAAAVVVTLRTAASWATAPVPHRRSWWELARAGAGRSAHDLSGSLMIVLAVGMCAMFVWMLLPLVVVVPGLLALALVAVEHRYYATRS